jgi:hypothetical protein
MPPNQLLIAQHALIVHASSLPTGFNQRPGVTLLLAREQRLRLEITGLGEVCATALLLPPEVQRRFISAQHHISLTVEPGHPGYGIPNDPQDPWYAQLWWPLLRSKKPDSEYN